ncbi:MAG: NAD-dependent epimerase/dehydratase family protein [Alphaproteobacteria bacterium]|nr:NAD-dependent epimerase/dehydratase family protein [Alphaproteobacteria bacterium]
MTTLVTGATGFVGSAVARALLAAGETVRVLTRDGSDPGNLEGLQVERVVGDLRDLKSLERAASGCQALFHVAADYRIWVPRPAEIYATNVDGSRNLMIAAAEAGVGRIVYTSSVAVLGHAAAGVPANEDTPVSINDMIGHYKRSKYLAEEVVRELIDNDGLPAVIVNPSTPIGPRDIKPTPTGRIVVDFANGKMPAYVDTGLNLVHVDDCAAGHLLAFEHGEVGQRYILGGDDMTLRDILVKLGELSGLKAPGIRLPTGAIMPIARIAETWARVTGREPVVSVDALRMARHRMFFSSAKAEAALGYKHRGAEEALSDALVWFHERGHTRRGLDPRFEPRNA